MRSFRDYDETKYKKLVLHKNHNRKPCERLFSFFYVQIICKIQKYFLNLSSFLYQSLFGGLIGMGTSKDRYLKEITDSLRNGIIDRDFWYLLSDNCK